MATLDDATAKVMLNAATALLDSGFLVYETSGDVEVAKCTFGGTAFGTATTSTTNALATANAITNDSDAAGGVVDHCMLTTVAPADVMSLTCTATGGGGDIELTSLTITALDIVSTTSLTLTLPWS